MRKVTFGGANSLDNYFARNDGGMDWLLWSDEVMELMNDFWPKIDTIITGRKTYETALESSPPSEADARDNGMATYVFSRTQPPGKQPGGAEVVATDPGEFVRELKEQDGKDICILGGGNLARALLEAGVIDEIGFNIHPVLLGSGVPLFYEMSRQIDLELLECKAMKNGCVYVLYRVKN
ncbi:MAG: dihydrofolate reductase family protein [Pyrinomonadaceae bacterium]